MPQTVPNNPIKGVVLPVVARNSNRRENRATSRLIALFSASEIPLISLSVSFSPEGKGASPCVFSIILSHFLKQV